MNLVCGSLAVEGSPLPEAQAVKHLRQAPAAEAQGSLFISEEEAEFSQSEDIRSAKRMVGKMSRTELGDVLVSALQKMPGRPKTEQVAAPSTRKAGLRGGLGGGEEEPS